MNEEVDLFLQTIAAKFVGYEGIRLDGGVEWLAHSFWSPEAIKEGILVRSEWDVADDLIPFYGDWHSLFCISVQSGKISYLDDERHEIFSWDTSEQFLASLVESGPATEDRGKLVSLNISPDLDAQIKALLKSKP